MPRVLSHRWITVLQILQFVTSFVLLAGTCIKYLLTGHSCSGLDALAVNSAVNLILLVLFIALFKQQEKQDKEVDAGKNLTAAVLGEEPQCLQQ